MRSAVQEEEWRENNVARCGMSVCSNSNPLRMLRRLVRGRLSHQLSSKRPENASSFAGCNNWRDAARANARKRKRDGKTLHGHRVRERGTTGMELRRGKLRAALGLREEDDDDAFATTCVRGDACALSKLLRTDTCNIACRCSTAHIAWNCVWRIYNTTSRISGIYASGERYVSHDRSVRYLIFGPCAFQYRANYEIIDNRAQRASRQKCGDFSFDRSLIALH